MIGAGVGSLAGGYISEEKLGGSYELGAFVGNLVGGVAGSAAYSKISSLSMPDNVYGPAKSARQWQGNDNYPGVDKWRNKAIKKGTTVWGGEPGQSNFYTTDDVMRMVGNDATRLNQGLQVGRGRYPTYRAGMTMYEVTEDITVGYSHAVANPQYGVGGFEQYFIEDYKEVLSPILTRIMTNR